MSTGVPVHHNTCSVYLFLFGITSTINFQLIYCGTYTQIYPKIKLPVYLHASLLSNHKDLPVTTTTCVHAHRSPVHYPACSFLLFHSDKQFVLTFLSPVVLNIRRFTLSSINRSICVCFSPGFTYTLICQLICWSAYRQTHPKMNVPANFDATWYVNLPVHLQTRLYIHRSCSSWSFLSGLPRRFTSTLTS